MRKFKLLKDYSTPMCEIPAEAVFEQRILMLSGTLSPYRTNWYLQNGGLITIE